MKDPSTPDITIGTTQATVSEQGVTYNQTGYTYNQAGIFYGGVTGSSDVIPMTLVANTSIGVSQLNHLLLENGGYFLLENNEYLLLENSQRVFNDVIPEISGFFDIYTPKKQVGGNAKVLGPGFFMFLNQPVA